MRPLVAIFPAGAGRGQRLPAEVAPGAGEFRVELDLNPAGAGAHGPIMRIARRRRSIGPRELR